MVVRCINPARGNCHQRPKMNVLICGGRDYFDTKYFYETMDALHAFDDFKYTLIVQGGARGADTLAMAWARDRKIPCATFPADWAKYGKRAGYVRNQDMLDKGRPELVIAFPGGRGTAMMVDIAKRAGVRVLEIVPET